MISRKKKNITNNLNQQVMLLSTTIELTNDQIKALPTTGVQIVAAPGAGKIIYPFAALGVFNTGASRYTNIVGAAWDIVWNEDRSASCPLAVDNFLDTEGISLLVFSFPPSSPGQDGLAGVNITRGHFSALPALENSPLYIKDIFNGVTNYTGGHADNKLKLTVYYVVVEV